MPDEHGIPTDEEIARWRARWKPEWVEEIVSILRENPEWGVKKIVELPWYSEENGFERWTEEERIHVAELDWRPVLDLRGLVLGNVELREVWLIQAHLEGILIEHGDLSNAKLRFAKLMRADLVLGVLKSADLMWADLRDASFGYAEMQNADLWNADLSGADFTGADLSGAVFNDQNLTRVIFKDTIFHGARLQGVRFSCSDLRGARFLYASIEKAQFIDCKLRAFDLYSSVGLAMSHPDTFFGRSWRYGWGRKYIYANLLPVFRWAPKWLRRFYQSRIRRKRKQTEMLFEPRSLRKLTSDEIKGQVDDCYEVRMCFKQNGLLHKAAIYYEQEEYWRTRAKLHGTKRERRSGTSRWLLHEIMIGYGEKPLRVLWWIGGLILLWPLIFLAFGIELEVSSAIYKKMRCTIFDPLHVEGWVNVYQCLLLSLDNLTGLNLSQIQPSNIFGKMAIYLERVLGILLIALATVTWARKAIRD